MLEARVDRVRRTATVQEDWSAWLPEAKDRLFAFSHQELEASYLILSVTLNDAITLCKQGTLEPAREHGVIFADLFDRMCGSLRGVLRALYEHGRDFGTLPNVAPLRAGFFRSERAQQIARGNNLFSFLVLRARKRFFRKLGALEQMVADLNTESRKVAGRMTSDTPVGMNKQWKRLEVLHYDLNTCLCETTVMLKSFFCVLPSEELSQFRTRLLFLVPAIALRSRGQDPHADKGDKLVAAPLPPAAAGPLASAAGISEEPRIQHHPYKTRDNSGSGDRIPSPRMRPDGTGGPNETN